MNTSLFLLRPVKFATRILALLFVGVVVAEQSGAEPFVPRDDAQVLERLGAGRSGPAARRARAWRARLQAAPTDLGLATQLAWQCIEQSRALGDPRYLGQAQAAMAPWWEEPAPPVEALVVRATIEQSQHDFSRALHDLEAALRLAPSHAQAWLTRATVLTVLGRYDEARRCCLRLTSLAPELVALSAAAQIAALTGQAESSYRLLGSALERHATAPDSERLWAITFLAETGARLGRNAEAESQFRRALSVSPRDKYALGAFADFLLDQQRPAEVVTLLDDETRVDALLLRLALAESRLSPRPAVLASHVETLRARFEASRLRGDSVHQREEARFTLDLLGEPAESLRLAKLNWEVQREPADIRVLVEAALAAGEPQAANPALDFITTNRLEDSAIDRLATKARSLLRSNSHFVAAPGSAGIPAGDRMRR